MLGKVAVICSYSHERPMQPIKIFCSYARSSRDDKKYLYELEKHLDPLKRQGQIEIWHAHMIAPGADEERETLTQLKQADIILLFVSSDYMSNDYCYDVEGMQAIEMENAGIAYVRVIRVRHIDLENAPFGWCQALPTNGKFITECSNRQEAYFNIVQDIKEVVREALDSRPIRETNRARYSTTHNNTLVKTALPPLAALRVNRRTDDLKLERQTEDLKRNKQTEELKQRKQPTRVRTESRVYADEVTLPEFTPTPLKRALPKARRKGRRTVAQSSAKPRSPDVRKWREQFSKELGKVSKGNRGIFLLLLFISDVVVIPTAILGWSGSWGLFGLAFSISLPVFAYGTVNIYNQAAIPLALLYAGAWGLIIQHYVSWHPLVIIGISSLIACIHFFLFRRHER